MSPVMAVPTGAARGQSGIVDDLPERRALGQIRAEALDMIGEDRRAEHEDEIVAGKALRRSARAPAVRKPANSG